VIGGFTRVNDPEVLTPFVEPYFDALHRVWQERTSEMAGQIVSGLYPALLAGPELLARTDRWLEQPGTEAALRRLVAEGRDGVVRAVAAQERDRAADPGPSAASTGGSSDSATG
jgi:aminopeptidase N